MSAPKFKSENLHLAIVSAILVALAYAAVEIASCALDYLLSLVNLFFHSQINDQ